MMPSSVVTMSFTRRSVSGGKVTVRVCLALFTLVTELSVTGTEMEGLSKSTADTVTVRTLRSTGPEGSPPTGKKGGPETSTGTVTPASTLAGAGTSRGTAVRLSRLNLTAGKAPPGTTVTTWLAYEGLAGRVMKLSNEVWPAGI